jgi:hypothetical protein
VTGARTGYRTAMETTGWNGLREALDDLDFPADKQQMLAHVQGRPVHQSVLKLIKGLPLATYQNMAELRRSVDLDPAGRAPGERGSSRG